MLVPVLAVGFFYSMKERDGQLVPRDADAWFKRYAKLRPHLEGEPKVAIFYDPAKSIKGNMRLFRAQYVLAPTVVKKWGKAPPPVQPRTVPLLFDFKRQDALDQVLAQIATEAREVDVAIETVQVARGLAVVWMSEISR